jgi:hypothetical protein
MEDRNTATASQPSARIATQGAERVESIMDFDSSGMITCLVTKPLAGNLGTIRDSKSMRSITLDEWREINGKQ